MLVSVSALLVCPKQLLLLCVQGDKNASKSSLRVLVNVGKAEVELLKAPQEGSSDLNHLARFMIGGLWVSFRTTYGGSCLSPSCSCCIAGVTACL